MKILITGSAGFIGYHLSLKLLERGDTVVGLDCINDYYDVNIKYARLATKGIKRGDIEYNKMVSSTEHDYHFIKLNLEDNENVLKFFREQKFDVVCNLAAQAGVRYSIINPYAYIQSNIVGYLNLLEGCRENEVKHFVYASSSSVYGLNSKMPLSTEDRVDHPVALYAASKKSNEVMAHAYSHLYKIPTTGLRFFTVYGPWGRPDMALFLFTDAILKNKPIKVFNYGDMVRDFTYVGDIVEGVTRVIDNPAQPNPKWDSNNPDTASSSAPYKIYNIGNNNPVKLMDFITAIEKELGKEAEKIMMAIQPGDVPKTYADVNSLINDLGYKPETSIQYGIKQFISWYKEYYNVL
jgi:UDP-glucuronate 4-epimerase